MFSPCSHLRTRQLSIHSLSERGVLLLTASKPLHEIQVKIQGGRKIRRHYPHNQHQHQRHQKTQNKFKYKTAEEVLVTAPKQEQQLQHQPNSVTEASQRNTASSSSSSSPSTLSSRTKRSISSPRHVETLIVADRTMVTFHNETVKYLLTIMNMVSSLYKDPSIGNSIEIVVVKIILLDEDDAHLELNLTQNAQQNLDTFCR